MLALEAGSLNTILLYVAFYVLIIATVLFVLSTDDREPTIVLAWLFVLILVPLLGFVAYLFLGRNYRADSRLRRNELATTDKLRRVLEPANDANDPLYLDVTGEIDETPSARVARVARREADAHVLGADSVEIYLTGQEKFDALLADLAAAQKTITLMYLIWERDELTAKVTTVLLDRLQAGVTVVILYDWLTSIAYRKSELRELRKAGALVQPCYRRLLRLNYRNHMKIAVVDGEVAYTGGMNMGQEYIDGGPRFDSWRDTHLRLTGPVVSNLQALTAGTWKLNRRTENLTTPEYMPATLTPAVNAVPVQVVYSSVWTRFTANRNVFITALGSAREQVWIQSPYFVPDEPLLTALCTAATSGIDVRFMMTGPHDKSVPWWVAHSYYAPLLVSGVRIYQYEAGFLHSKTLTLDDELTVIGTCNWDIRSIILHDEVSVLIHDRDITRQHKKQFLVDEANSMEVSQATMDALGPWRRRRNSMLRVTSRLL